MRARSARPHAPASQLSRRQPVIVLWHTTSLDQQDTAARQARQKWDDCVDPRPRGGTAALCAPEITLVESLHAARRAPIEITQIFTGKVFGIPICVADLTKNPVLGKYPGKPKAKPHRTFAHIRLRTDVGLQPLPTIKVVGELEFAVDRQGKIGFVEKGQ